MGDDVGEMMCMAGGGAGGWAVGSESKDEDGIEVFGNLFVLGDKRSTTVCVLQKWRLYWEF